jgi:hypothetical protein
MQRAKDYEYNRMYAEAEGGDPREFDRVWRAFADQNPIIQQDDNGNVKVQARPITFEDWLKQIPSFDANGRRQ